MIKNRYDSFKVNHSAVLLAYLYEKNSASVNLYCFFLPASMMTATRKHQGE